MKDNLFGGQWTKEKLKLFKKYTEAYLKIALSPKQRQWVNRVIYLDGFAGTGKIYAKSCDDPDFNVYSGSAQIILNLDRKFDTYFFIELDPNKVKELEKLKLVFPDKKIIIKQ